MINYKEMIQRAVDSVFNHPDEHPEYKDAKRDAIYLGLLARSLAARLVKQNEELRQVRKSLGESGVKKLKIPIPTLGELASGDLQGMRDRLGEEQYRKLRLPALYDLCPVCAGYTWGRPSPPDGDGMDYTRRQCSECHELRGNPGGDVNGT